MKLSAPMSPSALSNNGKTLVIPIYQRLFVWGEEQIGNLLTDLYDAWQKDNYKDYHIGVITIHEDEKQRWEVVDGQQRLTFLTLLGCELIRACKRSNEKWANCWDKFIWKDDAGKEMRLFFNGRENDRNDILNVVNGKNAAFTNPAFYRFTECFCHFLESKRLCDEPLDRYSRYCFERAAFLVNELPAGYGPQELNLHFEKMNSTGRQLSPLEVVKGKWFAPLAMRWNKCMNFDNEFVQDQADGTGDVRREELTLQDVLDENEKYKGVFEVGNQAEDDTLPTSRLVMRSEILALHALYSLCKRNDMPSPPIQRHRLIESFQAVFCGMNELSPKDYIEELENYREWMDKNIVFLQDTEGDLDYAFRTVAEVDTTDMRMKQFQTMLHVSSGEAQEWVLKAYLESNRGILSYDDLRKMDNSWHQKGSLDPKCLTYGRIPRYWFWKLDFLLWELHEKDNLNTLFSALDKREHEAISGYCFRDNISIEHLHPQSHGNAEWGFRDDSNAAMHRFGNLAMMSVEGNSSQQDDSVHVKFGRVKAWLESGRLESIKMLLMFHLADGTAAGWTVDKARTHERDMISILEEDSQGKD